MSIQGQMISIHASRRLRGLLLALLLP